MAYRRSSRGWHIRSPDKVQWSVISALLVLVTISPPSYGVPSHSRDSSLDPIAKEEHGFPRVEMRNCDRSPVI
jgi:hypothetical protein